MLVTWSVGAMGKQVRVGIFVLVGIALMTAIIFTIGENRQAWSRKVTYRADFGDVAGLKAVKAGSIDATMTQQTQFMGRLALDSALKLVAHQSVPKEQLQKAVLTTKDNVDQYIAKHP